MDPALVGLAVNGIVLLGSIGLVFGAGLGYAAHKFAVEADPLVDEVLESLPMAQCGGCGFPGCEGYAVAVVKEPGVSPNLCFPGKKEVAEIIANLTGKELDFQENVVATVRCSCLEGNVERNPNYSGLQTCSAAELAFGGPLGCQYGCTGLGECRDSCPFDAITMVDNFPRVSPELCVGCGLCVKACPKNIIELTTVLARVYVPCTTMDPAKKCKSVCDIGCIYCKACIKKCPADAFSLDENGMIQVDHVKCNAYGPDCNELCIDACPRDIVLPYPNHRDIAAEPITVVDLASGAPKTPDSEISTTRH